VSMWQKVLLQVWVLVAWATLACYALSIMLSAVKPPPHTETGAICEDGWQSGSIGSGTCSHHGGVVYWIYSEGRHQTPSERSPPARLWNLGNLGLGILILSGLYWHLSGSLEKAWPSAGASVTAGPSAPGATAGFRAHKHLSAGGIAMRKSTLLILAVLSLGMVVLLFRSCGGDRYQLVSTGGGENTAFRLDKQTGEVVFIVGGKSYFVERPVAWPPNSSRADSPPPKRESNPYDGLWK
jgi:hypothetical protein